MEVAGGARLVEHFLRLLQIEGLVLASPTAWADARQTRARAFEIRDDVFHDCSRSRGPLLGILMVDIHVPVSQSAGPETEFVVPGGIVGMDPPGQMYKPGRVFR